MADGNSRDHPSAIAVRLIPLPVYDIDNRLFMIDKQTYHLGPLTLQLVTTDQAQQQQVAAAWRQLFRVEPGAAPGFTAPTLRLDLVTTPLSVAPDAAPPPGMSTQGPIDVLSVANGFYCRCGATLFQINAVQPHAIGHVAADFWDSSLVVQRSFWQTLFFLLVRRTGCTFLHANALYPATGEPSTGVLLVGDCGSGKTSLTLSLLSAGWRYVTDDTVLLQRSEPVDTASSRKVNLIQAHAVRRGFACTDTTLVQWPWLAALARDGVALNQHKKLVDPDPLYPGRFAPVCAPRLLCFPRIRPIDQSQVRPLTRTQSFQALLEQPRNGLITEPAFTPTLLTLFQAVVEQCAGYELEQGRDVFREPARVSTLLAELLPPSSLEAATQ